MSAASQRRTGEYPLPAEWGRGPTYPVVEKVFEGKQEPWALSREAGRVLARIVIDTKRTRIIEFGAGVSSLVLAAALEEIGGGRLTSVEENPGWCVDRWARVCEFPRVDATLIPGHVRLTVDWRGIYYGYAETDEIAQRGPYDLVVIDAPAGAYGRDGAWHAVSDCVPPGGIIALDDFRRTREKRTVWRWATYYPDLHVWGEDVTIGNGIAILQRLKRPVYVRSPVASKAVVWGSQVLERLRSVRAVRSQRRMAEEFLRRHRQA